MTSKLLQEKYEEMLIQTGEAKGGNVITTTILTTILICAKEARLTAEDLSKSGDCEESHGAHVVADKLEKLFNDYEVDREVETTNEVRVNE